MPKIETRGVGLMMRKVQTFNLEDDPPEAFIRALDEWASTKPQTADEWRDANAKHCRAVLVKAYGKMDPVWFCRNAPEDVETTRDQMARHPKLFVRSYFGEDHGYAIVQEWLNTYDRLAVQRAKPEADIAKLIELAEELGKLEERLYWRAGVDPHTRERREAMALREKAATGHRRAGGAMNADAAAKRRATAHKLADDIQAPRVRKLSNLALAEAVHERWPDREPPSVRTLRKIVGKA